jgi:hypothetical protein
MVAMGAMAVTFAPGAAAAGSRVPHWTDPVQLSPDVCGGYEPGMVIDKYGNIFVTAHKQNQCDAAASDPNSPYMARAASFLWTSTDGQTWTDVPNTTAAGVPEPYQADVGDEGDLSMDDAGNLYFVDTKVKEDSFTQWSVTGPGTSNMALVQHSPVIGTIQAVDDRPWITSHGTSTVMFADNEGDKDSNPVSAQNSASGCGPGRYTVYMSHSNGTPTSWDHVGCELPDSGWCRPAADHLSGSNYIYVVCNNDGGADDNVHNPGDQGYTVGTLWAYVSADDGATWSRYKMDSYNTDFPGNVDYTWPSAVVDKNGYVYALHVAYDTGNDAGLGTTMTSSSGETRYEKTAHMLLYRSTDHGKTWAKQEVTPPNAGLIHYSWMAVGSDGRIGIGYFDHSHAIAPNPNYGQPNHPTASKNTINYGDWHVYGGISPAFGQPVTYSIADPMEVAPVGNFAFGDFFEVAFDPSNLLNIVYTRCTAYTQDVTAPSPVGTQSTDCENSQIEYVRQIPEATGPVPTTPSATISPSPTHAPASPSPRVAAPLPTAAPLPNTAFADLRRTAAALVAVLGMLLAVAAALGGRRPERLHRS